MTESQRDMWSEWLLNRRFGGDPARMNKMLGMLFPVRDKVLSHIDLKEDQTLLDVGCGDGLIAFGALENFDQGHVIFSDVSEDLLNHAEALAHRMNVQDRCRFVRASAEDLSLFDNNSVDAVTTRSVLIYVSAKEKAFEEFYRVLNQAEGCPSSSRSAVLPIPSRRDHFAGYDITPVIHIAQK